ncbi:MAG: hypothetical protein ACOYB3_00735 [Azonexus sp.]
MASGIARRLIGEAEETPPPPSIAQEWFNELGEEVVAILADGGVKHLELEATALMVKDDPSAEESTEHTATWEEAQNDDGNGSWTTVHDENTPITAFSVYARRTASRMSDEEAVHISDHRTHEEAETSANALAALLGVHVIDFSIATGEAFESMYDTGFINRLVTKALNPYLRIKFLDGDKEEIYVRLIWQKKMYMQGSHFHPGLFPKPTRAQLRQIGGPIGGVKGGDYAMEVIVYARYDGFERKGVLHDDPEDLAACAVETPTMYFRPLEFEFCNEGEPSDEMYE